MMRKNPCLRAALRLRAVLIHTAIDAFADYKSNKDARQRHKELEDCIANVLRTESIRLQPTGGI